MSGRSLCQRLCKCLWLARKMRRHSRRRPFPSSRNTGKNVKAAITLSFTRRYFLRNSVRRLACMIVSNRYTFCLFLLSSPTLHFQTSLNPTSHSPFRSLFFLIVSNLLSYFLYTLLWPSSRRLPVYHHTSTYFAPFALSTSSFPYHHIVPPYDARQSEAGY